MSASSSQSRRWLEALFRDTVTALDPLALTCAATRGLGLACDVHAIAVGKAAAGMALGAARALGARLPRALVVTPAPVGGLPAGFSALVAAHPVPDASSVRAAEALLEAVRSNRAGHLLALVSGGASALAALPAPGLKLKDKVAAVGALVAGGAPIGAVNTVRTALSAIKGGRLAMESPVAVTTLVLSDVVGDTLSAVGSGPTIASGGPRQHAALSVMAAYAPRFSPSAGVAEALRRPQAAPCGRSEDRAQLVAGLETLVDTAAELAKSRGVEVHRLDSLLTEPVEHACTRLVRHARHLPPGALLLAGGEPTIVLPRAPGIGGRAHHLALLLARELADAPQLSALVAGSDGVDGSASTAGAVVDSMSWEAMARPAEALRRADSATELRAIGATLHTGPTGVNHADLVAVLRAG